MRRIPLFAVMLLLAGGCQLGSRMNQHYELLNAEKRTLEDELYALRFEYDDALAELAGLRSENEQLKQRLGLSPGASVRPEISPRPRTSPPAGPAGPELSPPQIEEGALSEPKVEIPDEKPQPNDMGSQDTGSKGGAPPGPPDLTPPGILPPPDAPEAGSAVSPAWSRAPSDPRVTHIQLNPLLTGGANFDQEPGDDGLIVVVEPRNRDDAFVPLAGPLSVVLLDPERRGEAARLARWEFDAQTAQQMIQDTAKVKGIYLKLPWPGEPPTNSRLQVFVRYVTVDGRKLETSREFLLTLPGQVTQRWTPRSTGRLARADSEPSTTTAQSIPSTAADSSRAASPTSTVPDWPVVPAAFPSPEPLAAPASAAQPPGDAKNSRPATAPQWQPYR